MSSGSRQAIGNSKLGFRYSVLSLLMFQASCASSYRMQRAIKLSSIEDSRRPVLDKVPRVLTLLVKKELVPHWGLVESADWFA